MVFSGGVLPERKKGASASEITALIPSDQNDKSDAYRPLCCACGNLKGGHLQTTAEITSAKARVTEADALRELEVGGLREEVTRLKGELARARAREEEAPASPRAQLAAVTRELAEKRREEIADLRSQVGALNKTLSEEKCQCAKELGRALAEEERKNAEQAERIAVLETGLRRTREGGARCGEERERLNFALAFNGRVGSVPRSLLATAPESILYRMYCGEWDYARDEEGRALITCHPDRWNAVLEHLATGAVPAEPDPLLLAQARHWNLSRLVEGLEALSPGVVVTNDPDERGFKVLCTFVSLTNQLSTDEKTARLEFATSQGCWWAVDLNRSGVSLDPVQPPGESKMKQSQVSLCKWRILLQTEALEEAMKGGNNPTKIQASCWLYWTTLGYTLDQLLTEPLARARDSLVIEVEARFAVL